MERPVGGKLAKNLRNMIEKPVDLTEFRLFFVVYASLGVRNAEQNQKVLFSGEQILLLPVQ